MLVFKQRNKIFLEQLNAKNIKYEGNLKLINNNYQEKLKNENHSILLNSRFWVAASIHKEEDIFCLKTHIELKKKFSDIITFIARDTSIELMKFNLYPKI